LVFVTKYRHRIFNDAHLKRMEEIMLAVCADFECELVEFNGENNHVHLLVNFPPKAALSKLVNSLKGVSSRRLHSACGPARNSPDRWAALRFRSSVSTSRSRIVRFDLQVRALLRIASPPG
jgi:REP element-mobilizing transposase RayT